MSTSRFAGNFARFLPFGFAAVAFASACSSSSKGTTTEIMGTAPVEAGAPAKPEEKAETPVATPKKDAAPPEAPAGECSSEPSQTGCVTCCSSKHEDGSAVYFVALIDCMCLPANCAKECEVTLCDPENPKNADAECQTCVQQKNSACSSIIKSTCTAAPDCVAFDACIGQSDCAGKIN